MISFAEKPAIAPPVFVFQKDKAQRSAGGSSADDGEDSDKDESSYCPPSKRERTSSITQFPPAHSVSKNNVFMPSSFCQSPTGNNSDSEPEEKMVGFRLKPPTLIHGQAPSAGVPSHKPKEQQRSVLRPAVLQAPPSTKTISQAGLNSGTNGVNRSSEGLPDTQNNTDYCDGSKVDTTTSQEKKSEGDESRRGGEESCPPLESTFVFGQNVKDRAKIKEGSELKGSQSAESGETNYFLQYISTPSSQKSENAADDGAKFVFGQNMSDRVLTPPKCEQAAEGGTDSPSAPPCEPQSQDSSPDKGDDGVTESLEESAAAYTKATAKRCLLEKVEVRTGRSQRAMFYRSSAKEGSLQSRLVMRTQGSLRLILNTKLWPQMQADKASEKSVRITAMDTEDQGVKVFLISASSKDTGQLYAALHHRILALRSRSDQESEPRAPILDGHVPHPQSNEEDSDEDEHLTATANTTEGPDSQAAGSGSGSS
ncbi:hypothetical protein UPYG_G00036200 [Umbra pygmaea]|uniref:RanBD1 domain-containing protein n=1 Tax=Umbra pygmaea TaxID=75934 RepID=A0ABD0XRS2_UMBPY